MSETGPTRSVARLVVVLTVVGTIVGLTVALAVHEQDVLELDGDLEDGPSEDGEDWASLFSADGTANTSDEVVAANFFADHARPDPTYHVDSDKDTEDVSAWQCGTKDKPQDKTDILNSYTIATTDADGELLLYFGFERATNKGNSYMGFWFLQNASGCQADGTFDGTHEEGDLLLLTDFTGGGGVSEVRVLRWNTSASDNLELVYEGADCEDTSPGDGSCGKVNTESIVTPWAPRNTTDDPLGPNQLFEGGLAVEQLLDRERLPCFSTVIAETRTSQSITAKLKDVAGGVFQTCEARIGVTPQSAVNDVGDPHNYEFRVEKSYAGDPYEPVEGVEVNASIVEGPGRFVGPSTCTTASDGTCNVTIVAEERGTTVVAGEAEVPADGETIHVVTDGSGDSSGPATKTWERIASDTTTTPTAASITLGQPIADRVNVTGDLGPATGNVSFYLCSPDTVEANGGNCSAGGTFVGNATLEEGTATSPTAIPDHAGTWCFRGEYEGDETYLPSQDASERECFTVDRADADLSTRSDPSGVVSPGTTVTDTAFLDGLGEGFPEPTGAVTFYLCEPANTTDTGCPDGEQVGEPVTVEEGTATSASTTPVPEDVEDPSKLGTYCWRAAYSGDANYTPANHTDGDAECLTYRHPFSTLDKAVRVVPGGSFADRSEAEPGDTLEYRLVYENRGNADATEVTIVEEVPDRSTLLSCDPACEATGSDPGSQLTFEVSTVAPDETRTVTFQVQLDPVFPTGETVISNVAHVTTAEEGQTPSDEVTVPVTASPELGLLKEADEALVLPGGEVNYTLTFYNAGDAHAHDTIITEPLPEGTSFAGCSDGCTVDGRTVTWDVGTVEAPTFPEDPAGSVTLTVTVDAEDVCNICNTAFIESPDQDERVSSEAECVRLGPDVAESDTAGRSIALQVETATPALEERLVAVGSQQAGPGADEASKRHLQLQIPPGSGTLAEADVLTGSATSTIDEEPARARTVAVTEVTGLDLLEGTITASTVRAVATSETRGTSTHVSSTGSAFEDLRVAGEAVDEVAPNTLVPLPADTFGEGSHAVLREVNADTHEPEGLSGGTYTANVTVTMLRVVLTDAAPDVPGDQRAEFVVGQAGAESSFPQTPRCEAPPDQAVEGHASILQASTPAPTEGAREGYVSIEPTGGQQSQALEEAHVAGGGHLATAASAASGQLHADESQAHSSAALAEACLLPSEDGCAIEARHVRTEAAATADTATHTAGGTTLADLVVAGTDVCGSLGAAETCRPAPNTVVEIPGVGVAILNEQLASGGEDEADVTVRALRLLVTAGEETAGLEPRSEVIVAESHAGARFQSP